MAVKDRTDAKSIDWLLQAAGTEKGKNFRIFSLQRGADWRVMEDRDFPIGLQFGERLFEANSVIDGFLTNCLMSGSPQAFNIRRPKPPPNPGAPANPIP